MFTVILIVSCVILAVFFLCEKKESHNWKEAALRCREEIVDITSTQSDYVSATDKKLHWYKNELQKIGDLMIRIHDKFSADTSAINQRLKEVENKLKPKSSGTLLDLSSEGKVYTLRFENVEDALKNIDNGDVIFVLKKEEGTDDKQNHNKRTE